MPSTVKIRPGMLGARLRGHGPGMRRAIAAGITISAERARSLLVTKSPVYLGHFKNAWTARSHLGASTVASVTNDAPYAGIIERGSRPHKTSRAAMEALREWVRRKGLVSAIVVKGPRAGARRMVSAKEASKGGRYEAEITRVVNAIVRHWEEFGREGLFLVRGNLETFGQWTAKEIREQVNRFLQSPGDGA